MTRGAFTHATLLTGIALLAGCSHLAFEWDAADDFDPNRYSTYRWNLKPNRDADINPLGNHPAILSQVQIAIDRELTSKGFHKTTSENADLNVGFLIVARDGTTPAVVDRYFVADKEDGIVDRVSASLSRQTFEAGTLVIDVREQSSSRLVWRGAFETEIDRSRTPEARTRRIEDAVARVMKPFPARG